MKITQYFKNNFIAKNLTNIQERYLQTDMYKYEG